MNNLLHPEKDAKYIRGKILREWERDHIKESEKYVHIAPIHRPDFKRICGEIKNKFPNLKVEQGLPSAVRSDNLNLILYSDGFFVSRCHGLFGDLDEEEKSIIDLVARFYQLNEPEGNILEYSAT